MHALVLKRQVKNLLPKIVFARVALSHKLSKIKPGFLKKFIQLAIVLFFLIPILGYYPTIAIPPIKRSVVQADYQVQKEEIVANNFSKPPILPHPGYLSTRFSTYHPGVDIATGLSMPIHPITEGEVIEVGRDFFGLGNFVVINHENDFQSKYAHMGRIYVKTGDKVTQENLLGEVGLTGNTSGPHTHLEVTLHGRYIDPQGLLPVIPNMPTLATK